MTNEQEIRNATVKLIDNLRLTTQGVGLAGLGDEYAVIVQIFLYKYFNDKFGASVKAAPIYGERFKAAEKWDEEYDTFTEDEIEDLFSYLDSSIPKLRPEHTLAHLYNASGDGDFSTILDDTLISIGELNRATFAISTSGEGKVGLFTRITNKVADETARDNFAKALVRDIASFNFEPVFEEKYDFFSDVFEYLIKDFYAVGGGKYAEYYTPQTVASIIAKILVPDNANLESMTAYDPTAGTGTLLMAIAHQIGEKRCAVYGQDISTKSTEMLRLNLVLNNLSGSLKNIIHGNTLTTPGHKNSDGTLKKFNFVVSNPPFNLDFSSDREMLAADSARFWAGVPKIPAKKKDSMSIYTCFIQHVINCLESDGRAAIVVPTGFITAKSGVEKAVLEKLVDEKWICGCISCPSQIFSTTGTNVSILILDKSPKRDDYKVVLIDASKLGEDYNDSQGNKRHRLRKEGENNDVELIVNTFRNKEEKDEFSVVVSYDDIKEKGYSLSAGQYFDVKIEYVDITEEEFTSKMEAHKASLKEMFEESHKLESNIFSQIEKFGYNG